MTRKILIVSDDGEFKGFINIATLTLTKLNHQITLTEDRKDGHIDWIILDMDKDAEDNFGFISQTRKSQTNKNIKIVAVSTEPDETLKKRLFDSGCDSVMSKKEFQAAANNILIF